MALIKCENVSLGYEGEVVVKNVTLSVERGDYMFVIGENGGGKSTLIKGLLGLIRPVTGKIEYGDGISPHCGGIGYLPQRTDVQRDFPASVREVVMSGCVARSRGLFYSRADRERAHETMRKLGIHGIERRSYRELSGGQQQRVLLARALCAADKLLLLDEPVTGLDPSATAELYETVGELNREGITVIMVSHDIGALSAEAKTVLHIKTEPVFYGSRDDYMQSDVYKGIKGNKNL